MRLARRLFFIVTLIAQSLIVQGDVFTSTTQLTQLLSIETALAQELRHYLNVEYRRLDRIKKFIHSLEDELGEIKGKEEQFFKHPMNTYLFIRDFTSAWPTAAHNLPSNHSEYLNNRLPLPGHEDTEGSAVALMRLQDTYQLTTRQLVNGDWNAKHRSKKLNVLQCYELGKSALTRNDDYHALMWLQETLDQLDQNPADRSVSRIDVLKALIAATTAQNNLEHAAALNEEILAIAPENKDARNSLAIVEEKIKAQSLQNGTSDTATGTTEHGQKRNYTVTNVRSISDKTPELASYEHLCRFNDSRTIALDTSRLFCRYRHNNHPYLFLQPVKEEQLSEDPPIFVFYDIISDKTIEHILSIAKQRLYRARVVSDNKTSTEPADYRISKSAWIYDEESAIVARFSYFIEAVTSLDMYVAEALQLANYGIGGHYAPHCDFFDSTVDHVLRAGDRIATWLTYLSDVEQGGGTAFPRAGVHVKAPKGSAAFWYNLRASGKVDEKTLHAGCPVLIGNKWVANKWIRSMWQEFRRPCSLDPNM